MNLDVFLGPLTVGSDMVMNVLSDQFDDKSAGKSSIQLHTLGEAFMGHGMLDKYSYISKRPFTYHKAKKHNLSFHCNSNLDFSPPCSKRLFVKIYSHV